jgi:hypothetical protein
LFICWIAANGPNENREHRNKIAVILIEYRRLLSSTLRRHI